MWWCLLVGERKRMNKTKMEKKIHLNANRKEVVVAAAKKGKLFCVLQNEIELFVCLCVCVRESVCFLSLVVVS